MKEAGSALEPLSLDTVQVRTELPYHSQKGEEVLEEDALWVSLNSAPLAPGLWKDHAWNPIRAQCPSYPQSSVSLAWKGGWEFLG